jgi:CRISPR type III-associated protein (TIGR04423 family)
MAEIKNIENFADLSADLKFQGYIWLSDATEPEWNSLPNEVINQESINPFILEGHWYSLNGQYSLAFKNTGEQAFYTLIDWTSTNLDVEIYEENFVGHRLEGAEFLNFATLYQAVGDELCEGFPVYEAKTIALRRIKLEKTK